MKNFYQKISIFANECFLGGFYEYTIIPTIFSTKQR